jgi:type I restriction enzyme S subunit
VVTGKTPATSNISNWGGYLCFVTPTDFKYFNKNIYETERKITSKAANSLKNIILPKNSVIVTCIGSDMGKVAINKVPVISNQQINAIICNNDIVNYDYLYYQLASKYELLRLLGAGGSTMPIVNKSTFEQIHIPLPPLPEQERIAGILSAYDDKIALNRRMAATLEQMARTLFRQWFGSIEGDQVCLGDVVGIERGYSYKGSGLSAEGSGTPMHNLNSVLEGGGYKYAGIKYYNEKDLKERHLVYPGELVVANTEQGHEHLLIGYPAIVPEVYPDGIFSHHLYRLRPHNTGFTSIFLYHLLLQPEVRGQIEGATNGSTVNMLSKSGFESVRFSLPEIEHIQAFSVQASILHKKQEHIQQENQHLTAQRDLLLQKLFNR